jgi:exonuclease III
MFFFFAVSISTIVQAEDRRIDRQFLTIMTLNAEFLWDGVPPEEGREDRIKFPWRGDKTKAEKHMKDIAKIIIQNNPDIVNLVEVENEQALNTFNNKFLQGMGYKPYFDKGTDSYTGQDMSLLTRIDPIGNAIYHDNRKVEYNGLAKSVSKNYSAKFIINNIKIALIGLHFLSRPDDTSRKQKRESQAASILSMALDLQKENYKVIILGDFNDFDGAQCCYDHKNSQPITTVLSMLKEMDEDDISDNLINVSSFIPRQDRYTSLYDKNNNDEIDLPKEYSAIDHVLLSPILAAKVVGANIDHSYDPRYVSDHFPVIVKLKFEN